MPAFKFSLQQVLSVCEEVIDDVAPSSYFDFFSVVNVNEGTVKRLDAHIVILGMGRTEMHSLEEVWHTSRGPIEGKLVVAVGKMRRVRIFVGQNNVVGYIVYSAVVGVVRRAVVGVVGVVYPAVWEIARKLLGNCSDLVTLKISFTIQNGNIRL